jgi:putative ABC transport system permease protein
LFGIFGAILTLIVVVNTVNASLHEQQSELAILRSLGISRREIVFSVTIQILVVAFLGALVGFPIGRSIGFQMMRNYDMDFYGIWNAMLPASSFMGLASLFVIVLLAEIPGLRAAFRADLGQVSKSQSI